MQRGSRICAHSPAARPDPLKPVHPLDRALADVEDAVSRYARQAGSDVALRFVAAVEAKFAAIAEHPGGGSPRYAHELNLPGLRHHSMARFPWLVFYVEREDRIDVWRVLNARSDIPAWMAVLREHEGTDEGSD